MQGFPMAPPDPAAGGWTLHNDANTGHYFYYNSQTGQSVWAQQAAPPVQMPGMPGMDPQYAAQAAAAQAAAAAAAAQYGAAVGSPWPHYPGVMPGAAQYPAAAAFAAQQQAALAAHYAAAAAAANPTMAAGAGLPLGGPCAAASASSGTGPSTGWITNRLIEREKARMEKNYEEADKLRAELRQKGVEVEDRERTWKCKDGRSGSRPNYNDPPEIE
eukprot:TRINITY_DN54853_c0_g1_i1.p1 TRINITY_DN54853_c0_g1~~TRINITY_DN54853_c0_g1_i1.p1  ORF type:complete len:233 (-),score=39.74 TRINITY_DN54853_c0_g1_i1:272-919(-)